ncbi:MAG TPA: hypothetical protein VF450_08415 [Noviherbaspirillum sp.]|jgi:hypothetical protein
MPRKYRLSSVILFYNAEYNGIQPDFVTNRETLHSTVSLRAAMDTVFADAFEGDPTRLSTSTLSKHNMQRIRVDDKWIT